MVMSSFEVLSEIEHVNDNYPRTIVDGSGAEVTIYMPVERAVCTTPQQLEPLRSIKVPKETIVGVPQGMVKSYKPASSHAETNGAIEDVSVRAEKELEKLVSPLYSKVFKDESGEYKGVNYIFMKGSPGYVDSRRPRDREFFEFWQSIKQNMYLAQGDLYSSLVTYLDKKSNTVGDDGHDDMLYLKAEKELIEAISKRYFELLAKIKPT